MPLAGTAVGAALTGEPGTHVRRGAVEADITAVAGAVRDGDSVVAALSVVGPTHRMDERASASAAEAVAEAVDRLAGQIGFAAPTPSGGPAAHEQAAS